jgi:hypothetical protein
MTSEVTTGLRLQYRSLARCATMRATDSQRGSQAGRAACRQAQFGGKRQNRMRAQIVTPRTARRHGALLYRTQREA